MHCQMFHILIRDFENERIYRMMLFYYEGKSKLEYRKCKCHAKKKETKQKEDYMILLKCCTISLKLPTGLITYYPL